MAGCGGERKRFEIVNISVIVFVIVIVLAVNRYSARQRVAGKGLWPEVSLEEAQVSQERLTVSVTLSVELLPLSIR